MVSRGVKSKVFIHLWVLFFISLLIIDVVILFFVLEKVISGASAGTQVTYALAYQDYKQIQKVAFIFVVINSFFFALCANHLLTKIYYRPLQRLAKRAETYEVEDPFFFSFRKEDNEFSILSTSLNKMMDRIAEDQQLLKNNIDSLEKSNDELKKAQNEVIRAEKLATTGRLTSGIAHEIGNPIGIVLGYLDLLKHPDLGDEERSDFIHRSEKEISRISQIIRQLLDMSRPSDGESTLITLHTLLNDLVSVIKVQPVAEEIQFTTTFQAADDRVFGDPDRFRQVFLNLLLNAIDAVDPCEKGMKRIDIETKMGIANQENLTDDGDRSFIEVIVRDSGSGISLSDLKNIFDPFYTTKEPGKGTGLGLSVSTMIVEKFGGRITVANQSKRPGAQFTVALPLVKPVNTTSDE